MFAAITLGACGANTTGTAVRRTRLPGAAAPGAPGAGLPGGVPGAIAPSQPGYVPPGGQSGLNSPSAAQELGQAIANVRALLPAYVLEMRWQQKKGAESSRGVYAIAGMAPRTTRIEIKEGAGDGTKLLYRGGQSVKVKLGGLLGALPLQLGIDDERLVSIRGYTIADVDLPALLDQLGDPRHVVEALPPAPEPQFRVTGQPLLRGTARAEVRLDQATRMPSQISWYDTRELVYRIELRGLRAANHSALEL